MRIHGYGKTRKGRKEGAEETKRELESVFRKLSISFVPLTEKEIKTYRKNWLKAYAPADLSMRKLWKTCFQHRGSSGFLWHIFSFEILECEEGEKADKLFETSDKSNCVFVSNLNDIAYKLEQAEALNREVLGEFCDWTFTAADFSWTYSKTHEDCCGPYFYRRFADEEKLLNEVLSFYPGSIDISDGELHADDGFFSQNLSDAWDIAENMNTMQSEEIEAMIWAIFGVLHGKSRGSFKNDDFTVSPCELDHVEIITKYHKAMAEKKRDR